MKLASFASAILLVLSVSQVANAQVLFRSNMESDAAFGQNNLIRSSSTADPLNNGATFGLDYSASPYFIPEAPNTQPGDAPTTGLMLEANANYSPNFDFGAANAISVYPLGQSFSGNFSFQFDLWMNTVGPFPAGGGGSTEYAGGFIGYDPNNDNDNDVGTDPVALDGAGLLVSGEGGGSRDWQMYGDDEQQWYTTHNFPLTLTGDLNGDRKVDLGDYTLWRDNLGTVVETAGTGFDLDSSGVVDAGDYDIWKENFGNTQVNDLYYEELSTDNADTNTYLEEIFPGVSPPAGQTNLFPDKQTGTTKDGTLAFRWVTFEFTVDTDAGTALVEVTDADTGVTAQIGTFTYDNTYVNQDSITEKIVTDFSGNVALTYMDPFNSIAETVGPNGSLVYYSFGLFDNMVVTQLSGGLASANVPEPASVLVLGGFSLLGLAVVRKARQAKS
ncbi:PEP-CTERM sorting domain-containing protein [Aeoliella mucimassa]|uniref:Ice-binding protein C-terminal domain-containing protein n=1 Tax=Aeoliella mucimassa TaxID=2527972 RepID=A0A518AS54_9BACT|nr:PEP-CTERM sorting domain-containing protein [Aeoliella mucimassa]QDU57562.1 hypothetical protein Pan181_37800 [Aeoliella mucimassa]